MSAQSITLYCTSRYAGTALSSAVTRVAVLPHDATTLDVFIANASGPSSASDCTKVAAFLATLSWLASSVASVQPVVMQPVAVALDVYVPNADMATAATDVQAKIAGLAAVGLGAILRANDVTESAFLVSYVQDVANATIEGSTSPLTVAGNALPSLTATINVHGTG